MGGVKDTLQSKDTSQSRNRSDAGIHRPWLRSFLQHEAPELDAFIDWSKPIQVVSRRRVTEEGGQKPPHPKELFAVEVLCLDGDPTVFDFSSTRLESGALVLGDLRWGAYDEPPHPGATFPVT